MDQWREFVNSLSSLCQDLQRERDQLRGCVKEGERILRDEIPLLDYGVQRQRAAVETKEAALPSFSLLHISRECPNPTRRCGRLRLNRAE